MLNQRKPSFLLDNLRDEEYASIQHELQNHVFERGDIILKQGEVGQRFYMIQDGSVEVVLEGESEVKLAVLQPGDFFGEFSCLTSDSITATVRALERLEVQVMSRDGLLKLMDLHPGFMKHMLNQLLKRISRSNEMVQKENLRSTVFMQSVLSEKKDRLGPLIASSQSMSEVEKKIAHLADKFSPIWISGEKGTGKKYIAHVLHYRSPHMNGPILKISGKLFNREEWHRKKVAAYGGTIVITDADELPEDNVRMILQEGADHARLIFLSEKFPAKPDIEHIHVPPLRERHKDIHGLVKACLKQEGIRIHEQAISNSALRQLALYPFLDGNVKELFEVIRRAAIISDGDTIQPEHLKFGNRRVAGTRPRIGLALGAGVVRGCAHVGVLKVLKEENIPVDLIAGCSVGAIVGSLYAAGKSVDYMERLLPDVSWGQLVTFTFPKTGVLDNTKMEKWITRHIGERKIEQLPLPFATVATDSETGMPVILKSGDVAPAVRASTAIPLIMKPVAYQGKLLWDGSIVHKVPVHLARSMGADIVIAIDVGLPAFKKGKVKNLFDAFLYPLDIMQESVAQDELDMADVVLQPMADASGYSFKSAPVFFQTGEEEAKKAVPAIRKTIAAMMEV